MSDNLIPEGSLERLGIQVETPIAEDILTEGTARNVRFRSVKVSGVSKPLGYSFGEVDKFVQEIVIPSLVWYQRTLHERDKTVYKLGEELDKADSEKAELANKIKTFEYNASVRTGLSAFQEDKEVATLLQRLQTVEAERDALIAGGSTTSENNVDIQEYLKAIEERDDYIAQITEQYNQLQQSYVASDATVLEEQLQNKEAKIIELNEQLATIQAANSNNIEELRDKDETLVQYQTHIETITTQYNQLLEQYNQMQAQFGSQEEFKAEIANLNTALLNANSEVDSLTKQRDSLQSQYDTILSQVNEPNDEENVAILQAHIGTITEQYNQLLEQYQVLSEQNQSVGNSKELAEKDEALAQYQAHVEAITTQYNQLLEQYETLAAERTGDSTEIIAQYQTNIEAITAQYNQLFQQYQLLEAQKSVTSVSNGEDVDVQELYSYIETIRTQYESLLAAYNDLQASGTTNENNAELGQLRVELEASKAETARLQEIIAEYEAEEEENESSRPLLPLPLSTDKKREVPLPPQFANLPEGIRPEDLV